MSPNRYSTLFRLDDADASSVPLVDYVDFVGFIVPVDVEIVVDVIQSPDGFGQGDGTGEIERLWGGGARRGGEGRGGVSFS